MFCRLINAGGSDCLITTSTGEGPYSVAFSSTTLTFGNTQTITAAITNAPVGATIKCGASNNPSKTNGYGRWISPHSTFSLLSDTVSNPTPLISEVDQTVVAEGTVGAGGAVSVKMDVFVSQNIGTYILFEVACMVKVDEPATCAGAPDVFHLNVQRTCFPGDTVDKNKTIPLSSA